MILRVLGAPSRARAARVRIGAFVPAVVAALLVYLRHRRAKSAGAGLSPTMVRIIMTALALAAGGGATGLVGPGAGAWAGRRLAGLSPPRRQGLPQAPVLF